MNNNIISKIGWNVEHLFVQPVMNMKGDSATTSSSSSTTSNYPPINMILNLINEDVFINDMLYSNFKIPGKRNNNNNMD